MNIARSVCNITAALVSLLVEILSLTMRPQKPQTQACCKESSKALHWDIVLDKTTVEKQSKGGLGGLKSEADSKPHPLQPCVSGHIRRTKALPTACCGCPSLQLPRGEIGGALPPILLALLVC